MTPEATETAPPALTMLVPAYNEGQAVVGVLETLKATLAELPCETEIIVIDDGSTDSTAAEVAKVEGVRLLRNPVNLGYGHSLLRGMRVSETPVIGIIDADSTYPVEMIKTLYAEIQRGSDHAIGQRTGKHFLRLWSKRHVYRWLCRWVVGSGVPDANSGLRLFQREVVEDLRGDLCLGFSFTTSLTLASIMSGYVVTFTPMEYHKRVGRSHIRVRDILRTMQYLFQLVAFYNPIKFFLPLIMLTAFLAGLSFLYGFVRQSLPGTLTGVVMVASTLLLIGQAGLTYVVSRVGLRRGALADGLGPAAQPGVGLKPHGEALSPAP